MDEHKSTLPPQFTSGDIVRFDGSASGRIIDLNDKDWVEFRWNWPVAPAVSR